MSFNDTSSSVSVAVQGGMATMAVAYIHDVITDMIPFLIAAFILILIDLYFGIKASLYRKESVRLSRAIRRTVGKTIDYTCWCILSSTLSIAFSLPAIEWVVLGLVLGNELISCITNFFLSKGKVIKGLNIFKIVEQKAGLDLSDVTVEDDGKQN